MSIAKITLIGIEKYLSYDDLSVFDNLTLPDAIDKDTLTDNILLKAGEFEPIYADADFLTWAIGRWGVKWYRTFEKWAEALAIEYDPLNNYDRTEEWTTLENIDDSGTHSETSSTTGSDSASASGTSSDLDKISAYNNNTLVDNKQRTGSTSSQSSSQSTLSGTRSGNDSNSRDRDERRTGHAYGNIGVTTSQQMLQSELEVAEWNLYEHITDIFIQEFLIPIYD